MFWLTQKGYMNMAAADVCNTLVPAVPAPIISAIPYINIATGDTAQPTVPNVMIQGMLVHNLLTRIPQSNGDELGPLGGVVSGLFMGPSMHLFGSVKVMVTAAPATMECSPTGQNGNASNIVSISIDVGQFKVEIKC